MAKDPKLVRWPDESGALWVVQEGEDGTADPIIKYDTIREALVSSDVAKAKLQEITGTLQKIKDLLGEIERWGVKLK